MILRCCERTSFPRFSKPPFHRKLFCWSLLMLVRGSSGRRLVPPFLHLNLCEQLVSAGATIPYPWTDITYITLSALVVDSPRVALLELGP